MEDGESASLKLTIPAQAAAETKHRARGNRQALRRTEVRRAAFHAWLDGELHGAGRASEPKCGDQPALFFAPQKARKSLWCKQFPGAVYRNRSKLGFSKNTIYRMSSQNSPIFGGISCASIPFLLI